ncbi:MAG: hypothetical protein EOP54_23575 [Sphingobacteriales bacterium]|nr:MAG: hypothetical protein EOP54_23575 [Sphingobacteriales bacterium]
MTEEISNISLSFKCPADYAAMQDVEGGKFCTICQKQVHDFTNSKADYFRQIMAENGNNVCGRFLPSQMAAPYVSKPLWKKWVAAAMILLGFNLAAEKVVAQSKIKSDKQTVTNKSELVCDDDEDLTLGIVFSPQPEFPGGEKQWELFLKKNLKYIKAASGKRLFTSFVVKVAM